MFVLDSLLAAPFKGLLWIFEEVAQAASENQEAEAEAVKAALADLYRQIEAGEISEAEFDLGEQALLDHLDALEGPP